jgi:hypothetical protein
MAQQQRPQPLASPRAKITRGTLQLRPPLQPSSLPGTGLALCPNSRTVILSYPILSYPILSYPILSYPILSYPILSYHILSYPILSYPIP